MCVCVAGRAGRDGDGRGQDCAALAESPGRTVALPNEETRVGGVGGGRRGAR